MKPTDVRKCTQTVNKVLNTEITYYSICLAYGSITIESQSLLFATGKTVLLLMLMLHFGICTVSQRAHIAVHYFILDRMSP